MPMLKRDHFKNTRTASFCIPSSKTNSVPDTAEATTRSSRTFFSSFKAPTADDNKTELQKFEKACRRILEKVLRQRSLHRLASDLKVSNYAKLHQEVLIEKIMKKVVEIGWDLDDFKKRALALVEIDGKKAGQKVVDHDDTSKNDMKLSEDEESVKKYVQQAVEDSEKKLRSEIKAVEIKFDKDRDLADKFYCEEIEGIKNDGLVMNAKIKSLDQRVTAANEANAKVQQALAEAQKVNADAIEKANRDVKLLEKQIEQKANDEQQNRTYIIRGRIFEAEVSKTKKESLNDC